MDPEPTLNRPATEEMNTMFPTPDAFRRGCASWDKWYADSKLVEVSFANSSVVYSRVGFLMFVPTLFTYAKYIANCLNSLVNKKGLIVSLTK